PTLVPYTTLFRSGRGLRGAGAARGAAAASGQRSPARDDRVRSRRREAVRAPPATDRGRRGRQRDLAPPVDRMTTTSTAWRASSVPPLAPCEMPTQSLRHATATLRSRPSLRTSAARFVAFGGAAALTAFAAWQMGLAVSVGSTSWLQWALVALFTLSFGWIAWSAASAVAGL